jgi:hypothetical protein
MASYYRVEILHRGLWSEIAARDEDIIGPASRVFSSRRAANECAKRISCDTHSLFYPRTVSRVVACA